MTLFQFSVIAILLHANCSQPGSRMKANEQPNVLPTIDNLEKCVTDIKVPAGYKRQITTPNSFARFLQKQELKTDKTVYLYNGNIKPNQDAQHAVLALTTGSKNLQQCADAIMRLRAEYFYERQKFDNIEFFNGNKQKLNYTQWLGGRSNTRQAFMHFLDQVFMYCGTASLPHSLDKKPILQLQIGDVLLKPGSPGHAVIVMDMAQNNKGQKIYLLAQSYMPAQDMHILKNPDDHAMSPWYLLTESIEIHTPEWTFYSHQLYSWK